MGERPSPVENLVPAHAEPDDVRIAWSLRWTITKQGASVIRPGHLPCAINSLKALDPQSLSERPLPKIRDQLGDRCLECGLLRWGQAIEVALKLGGLVM